MDCFEQDFKWVFTVVFSTLLRRFLHLFKSQILSFKRRVYQEFFKSDFLEFSTTTFNLSFLTNT